MKELQSLGLRHRDGRLEALDQVALPHEERWVHCESPETMIRLIRGLHVRGAPLIGVAAALALAKFAEAGAKSDELQKAARALREARPTAVNLMWAVDRMTAVIGKGGTAVVGEAEEIFEEDVRLCEAMARNGSELFKDGDGVLTHCNTGGLATVGVGTALGVIRRAHEQGKRLHVYADETRPLLQGARLTAWELQKLGIPYTLICDNMAAFLMKQGKVQRVIVGADRVAKNGDFANKVGTYGVAVSARHHGIPFYVAAPYSTLDENCANGAGIPIEERGADEVRAGKSPVNAPVYNPAFDVTPAELLTALITDRGIRKFH